ncbi:MAG: sulfite exporter TauE/SafE family protein, partial [Verrucomicrobiota bacterium]
GGILGAIGGTLGLKFSFAGIPWLPALLILFLIAITLGLDKRFGTLPGLGRLSLAIRVKTIGLPPHARAAIIGLATPLLPCGPLYAMMALALAGGSAIRGVETLLAFGIGAIPAIWAVQISSSWVNRKLGAKGFAIAQKTLAGVAALSLMWHFSWIGATEKIDEETRATCRCTEP